MTNKIIVGLMSTFLSATTSDSVTRQQTGLEIPEDVLPLITQYTKGLCPNSRSCSPFLELFHNPVQDPRFNHEIFIHFTPTQRVVEILCLPGQTIANLLSGSYEPTNEMWVKLIGTIFVDLRRQNLISRPDYQFVIDGIQGPIEFHIEWGHMGGPNVVVYIQNEAETGNGYGIWGGNLICGLAIMPNTMEITFVTQRPG